MSQTKPAKRWLEHAERVVRRVIAEKYDRPSLVSDIASEIGSEIIEGILSPGDDLNSVELARRFSTSRTPIREALILLEKEGLVVINPRRRPAVFTYDLDQIREIYGARGALLELVAKEIAENATVETIAALRQKLVDMVDSQHDLSAYLWANVDFYELMTRAGGNQFVKRVVDSLLLRTLPLRRLSLSQTGRLPQSLDDHARLVRAFEERDANLAEALIRSNHRTALKTLTKAASPRVPRQQDAANDRARRISVDAI